MRVGLKRQCELTAVVEFKRRGAATKMVLPGLAPQQDVISKCDPALVKAIARGRAWFEELAAGRVRSLQELALRDGITRRYIRRLVDLASVLEPAAGRSDHTGSAIRRAHCDPFDGTGFATRLGRAPQTARKLTDRINIRRPQSSRSAVAGLALSADLRLKEAGSNSWALSA